MEIDLEQTVMELLINAGEARSFAMQAIQESRQQQWALAQEYLESSQAAARKAHEVQTLLIGQDEGSGKIPVNLIMVHAQDHLMTAMLCYDLAQEIILLRQEVFAKGEK